MAVSNDSKLLSLIDAGISNIWSLSLPSYLESLNLHGNHIQNISNLSHLVRLAHLDLSANQITVLDGLEKLESLKTLNLSCNLITSVDGVSHLRSLQRLDVSYNQVRDIGGLAELGFRHSQLQYVSLHGNKLRSVAHVVDSLRTVKSLRHLVLTQDGSGNPICSHQGYETELFSNLPQLESINDLDRSGKFNSTLDNVSFIPGLEAYLDFLLSSEKEQSSQESVTPQSLITPKIDAVMDQFRQKFLHGGETSSSMGLSASSPPSDNGQHTESMRKILSDREFSSQSLRKERPRARVGWQSSGEDSEPVQDVGSDRDGVMSNRRRKTEKSHSQQTGRSGKGARGGPQTQPQHSRDGRSSVAKGTDGSASSPAAAKAGPSGMRLTGVQGRGDSPTRQRQRAKTGRGGGKGGGGGGKGGGSEEDRQLRDDAEAVYKDLLTTLESERERRWKAEQATRRLANIVKEMQAKGQESESMKTSALEATCTLKQALLTEHEANLALKEQLRKMQEELGDVQESLQESRRAEGRSREALKAAEATMSGREAEEMADRVHQTKRLQEAQQRASAMSREAEVLRHAAESSKLKLQQLQETLATREQQHRQEMQNSYKLDSPELQKVISERVRAVERSHQAELVKQQERVEQLSRQYTELEEEFRYALHTEETRFQQLKAQLEQTSTELSEHKQLMVTAHRKDESSTQMVAELTALVKEQKGRIAELSKSKHEQLGGYKGRIRELEESLEDARKANSQVDSLKQAKSKLQATVQAQESVIEGLKAERKLWGQELAQQGASLSQDRGRLEAKIEALTSESTGLKKQLGRETDAVKIKAKMIEDQTETIRKLKEAVVEREETIKATREENVTVQRSLEDQVAELKTALDDTREVLDRSSARKEELKSQVTSLQEELTESRENHSMLSARWKEKSELIGRLEQQVTQMKNTWTQKEARVAAERDAALDQAKQALEKLKSVDSAFRQQLDVKEAAFQEALSRAQLEKQQEVELANRKVTMVEEEMRDLLRENEASKRAMETKVKKLTQALGDLQTDLL